MSENYYDTEGNTVPYYWQCGETGCLKFAVASIKPADGQVIGNALRCKDHIPDANNAVTLSVNSSIMAVPTETSYLIGGSNSYIAMLHQFVFVASTLRKQSMDATTKLATFKDSVVETTVGWDGGCRKGKQEFLEALGLEWPKISVTVTITFDYDGTDVDIDSYSVEDSITSMLDGSVENLYVDVDY